MNKKINVPFSPPDISNFERENIIQTLNSGWITTGPKTKEFEKQIAAYCGVSQAVCLNSATAAMELTLRLLGIGHGDEVITSAYTFTASASVISHVGAKIILCDVSPGSFLIDAIAIEKLITNKTKAIIAVDIGGMLCDYESLLKLAEDKKHIFNPSSELQAAFGRIAVIADAAHSFGSRQNKKVSGSMADFTCFSFHAVKNLTTAEGGAVVWSANTTDIVDKNMDDTFLYKEYMQFSLHGQSKDALAKTMAGAWEYDIMKLGYKCNMTDIAAAFGLAQLNRFDDMQKCRERIAQIYDSLLSESNISVMFQNKPKETSNLNASNDFTFKPNYHLYMTRINGADELKRNRIISEMANRGVAVNVHFKPLPMFTAYKKLGFKISDYPNSYDQYKNEISLPIYSTLSDSEAEYVCEAYMSVLQER